VNDLQWDFNATAKVISTHAIATPRVSQIVAEMAYMTLMLLGDSFRDACTGSTIHDQNASLPSFVNRIKLHTTLDQLVEHI
jgi:hypothetical protein